MASAFLAKRALTSSRTAISTRNIVQIVGTASTCNNSSEHSSKGVFFGAIDQGTSSTRFVVFNDALNPVASHQVKVNQRYEHPGWADMDPEEILQSVNTCAQSALDKAGVSPSQLAGVGVTNQRESSIVWDRNTGEALAPCILWFDDRTKPICAKLTEELGGNPQVLSQESGLRINPYFSAFKLRWLLENDEKVKKAAEAGAAAFGTVESFLLWKLTDGKQHITDCTNASRTMLMDLKSLDWSDKLIDSLLSGISGDPDIRKMLPNKIVSNSEDYGTVQMEGPLKGAKLTGAIGDQQSALVGQQCFDRGQMKNTFGTGQFLLLNTGKEMIMSDKGLLTTVGYKMGIDDPVTYAIEGSVAVSGVGIKWIIESLGFGENPEDIVNLASSVESTKGLYFVPAFNGIMAPHWKPDARGIMIGLTNYHKKEHVCRALIEALCFQCRDVVEAMGVDPQLIKVDGGVSQSDFAMQILSNLTKRPVERPKNVETTALGAAISASIGSGHFSGISELRESLPNLGKIDVRFEPNALADADFRYEQWGRAIERCIGWETHHVPPKKP